MTAQPLTWRELPELARRTARADRRRYRSERRPLSARRLGRELVPNLRRPLFVLGAPRSGTTFLGGCLSVLPEISYHHEPVATKRAARYVYEGHWGARRAAFFYRSVYAWLMRLHLDGDLRFAEKTPQNCFIVPFLRRAFPDAQFLHIVRDGRDAAISYSKKPWLRADAADSGQFEPGGYRHGPYARFWVEAERAPEFETTSDIHRCIWAWRGFTEAALAGADGLPAEQYHELRYEDLVRKPQGESERVLDFLGVGSHDVRAAFTDAMSRAHAESVERWRSELSPDDTATVEREAGHLLRRLGYVGEGAGA
jgi:hypothetical protein